MKVALVPLSPDHEELPCSRTSYAGGLAGINLLTVSRQCGTDWQADRGRLQPDQFCCQP